MTETIDYKRLAVFGVDRDMKDRDLAAEFNKFGKVINVYNTRKGVAFVSYNDEYSAYKARREMDGTKMNGSMNGGLITVKFATQSIASDSDSEGGRSESGRRGGSGGCRRSGSGSGSGSRGGSEGGESGSGSGSGSGRGSGDRKRLYILGVEKEVTKADLTAHCEQFGRVTNVHITAKGCAYVSYQNEETAMMAMMQLNETKMNGHTISVYIAKSKEEISAGASLVGGTLEEKEKEKEKEEKEFEKVKEEKDRVNKEKEKLINAIATLEEKEKELEEKEKELEEKEKELEEK